MNYTANYQLTQWEKDDRIMMEDFNDNNAKIDAALAEKPFVIGTYTGNNKTPAEGGQHIELGFRPRFVIVINGWTSSPTSFYILGEHYQQEVICFTDTGFTVAYPVTPGNYVYINSENKPYDYIAFR